MTIGLFDLIMDTLWSGIFWGVLISAIITILDFVIVKILLKKSEFTVMSYISGGLLMIILPNFIIPMFFASKIKSFLVSGVDLGQNLINEIPIIGGFLQIDDYVKSNVLGVGEIDSYIITRIIICLVSFIIIGFVIAKTMTNESEGSRTYYGDSSKGYKNYGTRYTTGGVDDF